MLLRNGFSTKGRSADNALVETMDSPVVFKAVRPEATIAMAAAQLQERGEDGCGIGSFGGFWF